MATYLGEFEVDREQPMLWTDAPDEEGTIRQVIVFRLHPVGDFIRGDLPDAPAIPAAGVIDVPAEPITPVAADIPPEENVLGTYTVEPRDEPVEYQRREAALLDRYRRWLEGQNRSYSRKLITIPGEAGWLLTDLHDHQLNELIEAKASASRVSVRAGLGQLLDYARYVSPWPKALLVPTRPRPDLLELLAKYNCDCIWETSLGNFERASTTSSEDELLN